MPIKSFDPYKVQECKALRGLPEAKTAGELLQKVALQVQPILRKRQLHVPLLSEFFPCKANLLGLNIGGGNGATNEIRLRLREAHSKNKFLPYTSILGTMLHELCHNHIGPHNQSFYALLEDLRKECEEFMARGVVGTGVGFDAAAEGRLGGRWRNPTDAERRLAILKAAEQRQQAAVVLGGLMPKGPQKLGGALSAVSPHEAAARAAVQRAHDAAACGCDELYGTRVTFDDQKGEVIVLDDDEDSRSYTAPSSDQPQLCRHGDTTLGLGEEGSRKTQPAREKKTRSRHFVGVQHTGHTAEGRARDGVCLNNPQEPNRRQNLQLLEQEGVCEVIDLTEDD